MVSWRGIAGSVLFLWPFDAFFSSCGNDGVDEDLLRVESMLLDV